MPVVSIYYRLAGLGDGGPDKQGPGLNRQVSLRYVTGLNFVLAAYCRFTGANSAFFHPSLMILLVVVVDV